jgi:ABC-type phosphate transport system ATPase subunit
VLQIKKIFALTGVTNTGKSTTIRTVYNLLRAKYPKAKEEPGAKLNRVDIKVVITINGVRIGIESQGDPGKKSRLSQSLKEFVDSGCSIIVCARRKRGRTFEAVEELRKKGYVIGPVRMSKTPNPSSSNRKAANDIVSEIGKLLNGRQ